VDEPAVVSLYMERRPLINGARFGALRDSFGGLSSALRRAADENGCVNGDIRSRFARQEGHIERVKSCCRDLGAIRGIGDLKIGRNWILAFRYVLRLRADSIGEVGRQIA